MEVEVIKTHPLTEKRFPMGFKATCIKVLTKEDKISEGRFVNHYRATNTTPNGGGVLIARSYVEPTIQPKGTFKDAIFTDINGEEVCGQWFYQCTGKSFSEFFKKL